MKRRFRIKTKAEFEKEFGIHWRRVVPLAFPKVMDCLLNMDITDLFDDKKISLYDSYDLLKASVVVEIYFHNGKKCNITKAMIVEDTLGQKINTILKI